MRVIILAGLLVLATVAPAAVAGQDDTPPLTTVDADHTLDCGQFEETGLTRSELVAPQLEITVAESAEQAGGESQGISARAHDYVRIDYDEDVERTLRIWIAEDCLSPYAKDVVSPISSAGPAAEYGITERNGTRYLTMHVVVRGPTDVIYPVSAGGGVSFSLFDGTVERLGNLTGLGDGSVSWQYVDADELEGENATTTIELENGTADTMALQYRAANDTWYPVPTEKDHPAPVYRWHKQGDNQTIYLASEVADPPRIRYVENASTATDAQNIGGDIGQAVDRFIDDIASLADLLPFTVRGVW